MYFGCTKSPENASSDRKCRLFRVSLFDWAEPLDGELDKVSDKVGELCCVSNMGLKPYLVPIRLFQALKPTHIIWSEREFWRWAKTKNSYFWEAVPIPTSAIPTSTPVQMCACELVKGVVRGAERVHSVGRPCCNNNDIIFNSQMTVFLLLRCIASVICVSVCVFIGSYVRPVT